MFHAPLNLPPTPADAIGGLTAQINELRYRADRVMGTAVTGPRGQLLTVTQAKERADKLGEAIETEEANGSQRHRRVSLTTKLLILIVVVVVDFPIMLWLASSVFNVSVINLNVPLAISVVVSILTTAGAAVALYHLGGDQRQNKDYRRHLDTAKLTIGSKISLAAVGALVLLISCVAFYRIWTEGVFSGLDRLAFLLAILVALVMLISAWLVFWTAFRDGSPEQDDLTYYTRLVQRYLRIKTAYEDSTNQLERQIETIKELSNRSSSTTNGRATQSAEQRKDRESLP